VTAATGMDALTHCIEVYANRFAHPMIDLYALEGIRLIAANLPQAVENGDDVETRANMALGSLYGGLGLAPVNTAAVHALAYPLGGEFHVAHGVSNAVLLPHVLRFNLSAAPERYAQVALALGVEAGDSDLGTAQRGLDRLTELSRECGIPGGLSELGVPAEAIPRMAQSAMKVTRLLQNNLRELTVSDVEAIYRAAY
jgi:alcohol dehydrogenase class IV